MELRPLLGALSNLPNFTMLDLTSYHLILSEIEPFVETVSQLKNLAYLNISDRYIHPNEFEAVAEAFSRLPKLTKLVLKKTNTITPEMKSLKTKYPFVTYLNFDGTEHP